MNRRELLAGIIPLSITAAVAPGVLLATKNGPRNGPSVGDTYIIPNPGTEWTPVPGNVIEFDQSDYYFKLDQAAGVCPTCDVRHVRFADRNGRGCYTPDLIARIEQLQQEFAEVNDDVQAALHRNDDLHDEIGERGNKLGDTNRTWNERREKLSEISAIAMSPGNADYDAYLHGMANGLIMAESIMDGCNDHVPPFLSWGESR